jgi:hypothetical protein
MGATTFGIMTLSIETLRITDLRMVKIGAHPISRFDKVKAFK